jgi:uroporphyrinogen-III synthase
VSGVLAGRRVLVTRRWPELAEAIAARGGSAAEVPVLEIGPPEDPGPFAAALLRLAEYDWLVFTSAHAVEAVASALAARGGALPAAVRLAAVGPATTEAVAFAWPHARVEVQPANDFRGTGLVEAFASHDVAGRRVLLPVSDRAASTVEHGLAARGAHVDRVVAYRTLPAIQVRPALLGELQRAPDAAVFASPSAVEAFLEAAGSPGRGVGALAVGPTTAEAVRAAGLTLLATAERSTVDGLLDALVRALAPSGGPDRGSR